MTRRVAPSPEPPPTAVRRPVVWSNVAFLVLTPIVAAVAVPWYVLTRGVGWVEIAACVGTWLAVGLGVTAGYHRLFSHRAWDAPAPVRMLLALLGAASFENSVINWAAAHRYHHRHVDTDDDPYNARRGFFYSHMGWIMIEGPKHEDTANVPDLWKDPVCRFQHRHYLALSVGVNAVITVALGLATGNMLGMVVFGLVLRMVLTHHFTFLINSAAHTWGRQPWSTAHSAKDSWFLSLLTFGEGYHNYHHTFQSDYRNGALWYNWDPTKWLIWTLSTLRLARGLRRSPVDVTLRRRFEQSRATLEAKLESAGSALGTIYERGLSSADAVRARVVRAGEDAHAALARRLLEAEQACDEALSELAGVRERLQAARSDQMRTLRRQVRRTRRRAEASLRDWLRLAEASLSVWGEPARG